MLALVLFMLVVVALAVAVVGLVAVPARQKGRHVLTAQGSETVARASARASELQTAATRATAAASKGARPAKPSY